MPRASILVFDSGRTVQRYILVWFEAQPGRDDCVAAADALVCSCMGRPPAFVRVWYLLLVHLPGICVRHRSCAGIPTPLRVPASHCKKSESGDATPTKVLTGRLYTPLLDALSQTWSRYFADRMKLPRFHALQHAHDDLSFCHLNNKIDNDISADCRPRANAKAPDQGRREL
jgi:hypothetical protein